ncbi:hypothetical protein F7R12_07165 [Pseudomonas tolaasii]|nr:hypothetical protein F7R12_07165 [Pseudomonas tolaasii]
MWGLWRITPYGDFSDAIAGKPAPTVGTRTPVGAGLPAMISAAPQVQGLMTCHAPPLPSPVLSPALWSSL